MDKKSKIILILLVITLLSLSSYASLSRFSKGINKEGSINTTELGYCQLNEIETLGECLIRNDSKQEMNEALAVIDERTSRVDFSKMEPINIFEPTTTYRDIKDKTSESNIAQTSLLNFTYTIESKLINPFSVNDNEIENITFNQDTGYYTFTNVLNGDINDIVTTEEDMANGTYKYTCLNISANGNCTNLFLITEAPYLISNSYLFKQGYRYSNTVSDTTSANAGLYKGDDDYTVDDDTHTYYYRGDVNNNWVKFGNSLWRVVRINGNGTIRMIYSGLVDAPNHMNFNARIGIGTYFIQDPYNISIPRVLEPYDLVSLSYKNSMFVTTYAGYMYNPDKVVKSFPDKELRDATGYRLNSFPLYEKFSELTSYYFFKNFNPQEDCYTSDGTNGEGTCVLKCNKLGEYGEDDVDCIYSTWTDLMSNPANYSDTAPGTYKSSNVEYDVYQMSETDGGYRYMCADTNPITQLPDGDMYVACPMVVEIVGTVKDNPRKAKVKYHGIFPNDEATSNINASDSNVKRMVDTWYEDNILNQKDENNNYLEDYLSDGIFCNDRTNSRYNPFPLSDAGGSVFFDSYYRIYAQNNPSFKCLNKDKTFNTNDAFTLKASGTESRVEASGIGNKMLDYPVALMTADEVTFAGGKSGSMNRKFYLYTGITWWTMTPSQYDVNYTQTNIYAVTDSGNVGRVSVSNNYNVRPVINLKSDILYKGGTGTEEDPYIIDINN